MKSGLVWLLGALVACGGSGNAPVMRDADELALDLFVEEGACPGNGTAAACSVLTQAGCCTGTKCTWALVTDPTSYPGLGSIECEPQGTVAIGGACAIRPAAQGGYDNCIGGGMCVAGVCEKICDDFDSGGPSCDDARACVTKDGLFANEGATTTPAGVCELRCDPLDDNDFDGAGSAHAKTGTICGSDPTVGCYGLVSNTTPTYFSCMAEAPGAAGLTHRSTLPASSGAVNSCAPGYTLAFTTDTTGSNVVDCYAFCRPGNTYLGNPNAQVPNGMEPHGCNPTDALGDFGAIPDGGATSNGEHCMYSWNLELDSTDTLHRSQTSNTVGICFDHTKYMYDSDGDGTVDTVLPPCAALAINPTSGLSAIDLGCVDTALAGVGSIPPPRRRVLVVPR